MKDKDVFNLLNSIGEDLIDEKIDEIMNKKGESINVNAIKDKTMDKINEKQVKGKNFKKKTVVAVAIAATLTLSTVYASEISDFIKSLSNKSVVYSTVVDGTAYYLPEEIKLNDDFTLLYVNLSDGLLEMTLMPNRDLTFKEVENLNISVVPKDNQGTSYSVGGYGYGNDGAIELRFMNAGESNYNIKPFKDFDLIIDGKSYDISLEIADKLNTSNGLVESEVQTDGIMNIAGRKTNNDGKTNIQLIAGFKDPELRLISFGEPTSSEYVDMFENNEDGTVSTSTAHDTKPIVAYDEENNSYELNEPKDAVGRPITMFETTADYDKNLSVELTKAIVGYEKEIDSLSIAIPDNGKVEVDTELDFIIQKLNIKSIERASDDTAIIEFELNTGEDDSVSIIDIGAYSDDVVSAITTINDNKGVMTIKFDENVSNVDFEFSYPSFLISGNWLVDFSNVN